MSLKRILDKQLELNEYDAFGGGVHWEDQEAKDINRLVNCYKSVEGKTTQPTFKEQLQINSNNFVSQKLDKVKRLLTNASIEGKTEGILHPADVDDYTLNWLKNAGLTVEKKWSGTREDGSTYYKISW